MAQKLRAAARAGRGGLQGGGDREKLISSTNNPSPRQGQFVDRFGHVHSSAIFKNWSPAAIKAMGIRRLDGGAL
jgi:hypothetical protein